MNHKKTVQNQIKQVSLDEFYCNECDLTWPEENLKVRAGKKSNELKQQVNNKDRRHNS